MKDAVLDIAYEISSVQRSSGARFSICTLVTDFDDYEKMIRSFLNNGFFKDTCEYLYINNSRGNKYDAFESIRLFLARSQGDFVILCHQDIVLMDDSAEKLNELIAEVDAIDPNWAILGNAGGVSFGRLAIRISDPHGENMSLGGPFPRKVVSLDENFLLIRRIANLGTTAGMTGFHLYGTDLCLCAIDSGYSCYVINFHLRHASGGHVDADFRAAREKLIHLYGGRTSPTWIQTTCTGFSLSRSRILRNILNRPIIERLSKRLARLVEIWRDGVSSRV